MIQILKKLTFPLIALVVLLLSSAWLYKTETATATMSSKKTTNTNIDKNFSSNDDIIIKERHIGSVKLDTLKALIAQIGWNDKVKVETKNDEVSILLVLSKEKKAQQKHKKAYQKIFLNGMGIDLLLSQKFETPTPLFTIHNTDEIYGYTVKLVKKDDVAYAELPFEFLLGLTDERGREKASTKN
ncbi:MAG: hypothetical protein AAFX55_20735 [Bacteroidota bacterium]